MLYLELFNKEYVEKSPITGLVMPTDLNYLRRLYTFNNDSITSYYKDRNFAIKNTNILSRILEHFPYYQEYDSYRYVSYSMDKIKYLSKHFKFTSEIEKGVVHPAHFFGNKGEELIIADFEQFDISELDKNWQMANSISFLRMHRNDSKLLLPSGKNDESKVGLSTILINIPKLALQYRNFLIQQSKNVLYDKPVYNKNHFVIKYVLSNTIKEIVDHMVLNRVMDRFYGNEIVSPKYKHKFKIFEPNTQLDRYVEQTIDVITNKKLDFINTLSNIHLMFKLNATELLTLPEILYTRNIKTMLFISRLDHIVFLYDIAEQSKSLGMNKHYLNDFSRLAKRTLRDNMFNGMFSYETEKDLITKLNRVSDF
jgi:hypothetical protein